MSKKNENRWRCLVTGCNPRLFGEPAAQEHKQSYGHRVAKWPVRSAEGKRRARLRNKTGYYDKYNTGAKHATARLPQYAGMSASSTRSRYGCENPGGGQAFSVGGEFEGYEYPSNCGDCDWCDSRGVLGSDEEFGFGEDDF